MELKYLKEMEKRGLKKEDLPEDARIGIDNINQVLKAINMAEKKGNKIAPATFKKLAAMDKWTYYEILDHVHDTDKNADAIPVDAEDVIEEIENSGNAGSTSITTAPTLGDKIESELAKLFESGVKEFSLEDVKSKAKNAYTAIWDNYDDSGDNGVETTGYTLIETAEETFTIKKK